MCVRACARICVFKGDGGGHEGFCCLDRFKVVVDCFILLFLVTVMSYLFGWSSSFGSGVISRINRFKKKKKKKKIYGYDYD